MIVSVQVMLIGMSIECSLKALWLTPIPAGEKKPRFATPGAGFIRKGKLQLDAMPGATHHDHRRMAETVGKSDVAELELLDRMSSFVKGAGRYPAPGSAEEMRSKKLTKSGLVIPWMISVEDLTRAEGLAVRLLEEATPWK